MQRNAKAKDHRIGCFLVEVFWCVGTSLCINGCGMSWYGHILGIFLIAICFPVLKRSGFGSLGSLWIILCSISIAFIPATLPANISPKVMTGLWPWRTLFQPYNAPEAIEVACWSFDVLILAAVVLLSRSLFDPIGIRSYDKTMLSAVAALSAYLSANNGRYPDMTNWSTLLIAIEPFAGSGQESLSMQSPTPTTNENMSSRSANEFRETDRIPLFYLVLDIEERVRVAFINGEVREMSIWGWMIVQYRARTAYTLI